MDLIELILGVLLELFAHRIVGWALSNNPDTDLTLKALDYAFEMRGEANGILPYSDQAVIKAVCESVRDYGDIRISKT